MTIEELQVLITANTKQLQKEIDKTNTTISGLKKTAEKSSAGVMSAFNTLRNGIIALGIGKVIKDSIMSGMNAIESDNLFETSLGNMADSVRSWSNEVGEALGLDAVAMRKNTGVIYNMTTSMGLAEQNALKMSKGISLLTEDMASFYNLSSDEAFNKLRAGLTGETEPLKALGILVDENTVKQVAYQQGIAQTGAELTQQEKVLARYVAILMQTGNAQGDLARTINAPANQLRILKNQVVQLGRAFSSLLMPVIQAVLPYLIAFTKVVTTALNGLAKFLGIGGGSTGMSSLAGDVGDVSSGLGGVSDNIGKAGTGMGKVNKGLSDANKNAKKLKGQLAGFDEMTVLTENTPSASSGSSDTAGGSSGIGGNLGAGTLGAIGGLGADGLFNLGEYGANLDKVSSKVDEIAEKMKNAFSNFIGNFNFDNLINAFTNLYNSLVPLGSTIWEGLKWAYNELLLPLAQWTISDLVPAFLNAVSGALDFLNPIISDSMALIEWLWDTFLKPVAEWTGGVIVDTLNGIGDALKWISKHQVVVALIEGLAISIGLVSGALAIWNVAVALWNSIGVIATGVTSAFGVAVGILTSPITLVIGAIALLVAGIILLVKNWDTVKETAVKVWDKIKEVWGKCADWINTKVVIPVKNFFTNLWTSIKSTFSSVGSWFSSVFTSAWTGIKNAFSKVTSFFSGIWTSIKNIFSKVGSTIASAITNTVKTAINGLLSRAINIINGFISAINLAIKVINAIPGVKIDKLKKLEVPKLARGGIVDSPTIAQIGEAGKEAVVPLERNTGWIDQLADKINSKGGDGQPIQLTVKLGEDTIYNKFVEYSRSKSFETNGEVFSL